MTLYNEARRNDGLSELYVALQRKRAALSLLHLW